MLEKLMEKIGAADGPQETDELLYKTELLFVSKY